MSALARTGWSQPLTSDIETRTRVERVLSMARVVFAILTLGTILVAPDELSPNASVVYVLLSGYVSFSAVIVIVGRLAPRYLLQAGVAIQIVDVLFAAAIMFVTLGMSSPFFGFFVFVLIASPPRGGVFVTIATGVCAVVLFLAATQFLPMFFPIVGASPAVIETTRTIMRAAYLLVLALMLGFGMTKAHAFRAEANAVLRALAGACGTASFSEALRVSMEECLERTESQTALLAAESRSTQQLYLWRASCGAGKRATLVLEDLMPADREIYFAPPPRDMVVWRVRRVRDGHLSVSGLDSMTVDTWIRGDGAFMRAALDRHSASSALTADIIPGPDWRVRLLLLDPKRAGLDDCYFIRHFAREVGPALYNEYSLGRVRSRVVVAERARLAGELHDGLLQSLIGLEMEIEVLRCSADRHADEEARLRQIRDQLRHDIADVRDLMLRLRLVDMTGVDVLRVIAELAGRLRRETGIDVRVTAAGSVISCTPRNCEHLVRIVQEMLTNVRKHSRARSVTIEVMSTEDRGRIKITDDGQGFGFKGRFTLAQLDARDLGPKGIKERVHAMRSELTIESTPGSGASIEIDWPQVTHA
jgi:signal transduction histidine kinase